MESNDLTAVKRRLSSRLMALEGVTGIGIRSGTLAVYLVSDAGPLRESVERLLEHEAPGVSFQLIVSGVFHPRSGSS